MTLYVILRAEDADSGFKSIGTQEAGGSNSAITNFLNEGTNGETHGEGLYRAVAKSSWPDEARPIKRKFG